MREPEPSSNPPALAEVGFAVCGTRLSLLVRPGTIDERVIHEVVRTYRIDELVERFRSTTPMTVFDIGGHIGSFSVIIATLLPQCVVHVFEPVPANFDVLVRNIRHAGLERSVHAHRVGISGRSGFVALEDIGLSPDLRNTGGHSVLGPQAYDAPPDGRAFVELVPLGELLGREARVDLLKIDCEGAEFEILYSLTPAQLAKIDSMVGEIHSCTGFAGTTTGGLEWNAAALTQFLAQRYATVETDHRMVSDSAVLDTFHATDRG